MTARDEVRECCAGDDLGLAQQAISALLHEEPGTAATQFAATNALSMAGRLGLPEARIVVLASFTVELVEPYLAVHQFLSGRRLVFRAIPYGQWYGALTSPGRLDEFQPAAVFLLLHLEDAVPLLARQHLAEADRLEVEADQPIGGIAEAVDRFRERSPAPIVVSTFVAAERGVERFFDRHVRPSRQEAVDLLNQRVSQLAQVRHNVFVFDYAQTVTDFGRLRWFDPVKDHHVKAAVSTQALPYLAGELSAFYNALLGPRRKVLAVDLDNTLWGGVVGEDGPEGLAVNGDYPGNAFADFQKFLLNLRASGIALAVVSKNNLADVDEAFAVRSDMPIRLSDFAAHRIDWNDKVTNLDAVARELNVGIDAITFVDDNPLECDLVRHYAPEICTVRLHGPPSLFARQILEVGGFDAVFLTEEDRGRAESYRSERVRAAHLVAPESRDQFLAELQIKLALRPPRPEEVDRVVQLFSRTNQFNLTTRRYQTGDVLSMLSDPRTEVKVGRLSDRYGGYGLICIVVTKDHPDGAREIDSLLMSCRALGRNVEDAVLADLDSEARKAGRTCLIGRFVPTAKNGLVADLYPRFGFARTDREGVFMRRLAQTKPLDFPPYIDILRTD